MIRKTFQMLHGVGPYTERRIRREGCACWDDFLARGGATFTSRRRNELWQKEITRWGEALAQRDERFFYEQLPRGEHWRLFEVFGDDVACLDIETTGQAPPNDETTVVGIYRPGRGLRQLVAGRDLSGDAIDAALEGVKLLVTFFGANFDLPFLQKEFSYLRFEYPHYDLCFAAKRVGIKGGLKKVEKQFEIAREGDVDGLDGYAAVLLWQAHCRGDASALDTLLKYNAADTENLLPLAAIIYERLCERENDLDASPRRQP
ncbi:MAG: ribonuclease H-like domain-containing protein [Candidatus Coatesbacteria bacterium]|nr:MAG: ribonuclease H-like domain-containing protein [Candidatus Coatesbacteria bacterium]